MRMETFELAGMRFEYDPAKNEINIRKHGISFRSAARIFFDYDRIEAEDLDNEYHELRYDVIGDTSAGNIVIGNIASFEDGQDDILFVVYTERTIVDERGMAADVTRLISARRATNFERGIYYGQNGSDYS